MRQSRTLGSARGAARKGGPYRDPGRDPHQALDALAAGIGRKKVNWVLDADIRDFFGQLDRAWLERFLRHRIADERVLRLIGRWLAAGVVEEGAWSEGAGAPQGASASPLLANVYLHYVLDLFVVWWRRHHARGEVIIVRFAAANRAARGQGKPETFDFLGFTHICGKTRNGRFQLKRITIARRLRAKLAEVKDQLRRRMHEPIPEQGRWLASVVRGHMAYYAVPGNTKAVAAFRDQVSRHWFKALRRRSQRTTVNWARMNRIVTRWLPRARVMHPYPNVRFDARTQGRSPVR